MNSEKLFEKAFFLFGICLFIASAAWTEPDLVIKGTHFTLDGEPVFLLGISYYGALGAPREAILRDLDEMKTYGFNWIRVWATWAAFDNDVAAVDANGEARQPFLDNLKWLIEQCGQRGMIVDVTLSRGNGVTGAPRLQTPETHQRAARTLTQSLQSLRNWYLDMGNERNIKDKRYISLDELADVRKLVKSLDPRRLVTASWGGDMDKEELRRSLLEVQLDFIAPHRPRGAGSAEETARQTGVYFEWMKEIGRMVPVHYQEPFRRGYSSQSFDPQAADFVKDLKGAIQGGAAGWCFHNGDQRSRDDGQPRRSFDMRGKRLFEQLDEVEMDFLKQLKSMKTN